MLSREGILTSRRFGSPSQTELDGDVQDVKSKRGQVWERPGFCGASSFILEAQCTIYSI
jgi:hypothetical protein